MIEWLATQKAVGPYDKYLPGPETPDKDDQLAAANATGMKSEWYFLSLLKHPPTISVFSDKLRRALRQECPGRERQRDNGQQAPGIICRVPERRTPESKYQQ